MRKPVAIIPARSGSKRIPLKNIKEFCGKPMIAYSIEAAKASGCFERIVVSTDSQDIAAIARDCGAEVPYFRPPELSNDHATSMAVLAHALEWERANRELPEHACMIYATAPFLRPVYLLQGLELISSRKADTAFSATSFPFPIFRGMKITSDGYAQMIWPEHRLTRSQDLPEAIHDAGQFYWVHAERFLQTRQLFTERALPVILPRWLVQDIDTPEDWGRAELASKVMCSCRDPQQA